jgi:hypothetical protein
MRVPLKSVSYITFTRRIFRQKKSYMNEISTVTCKSSLPADRAGSDGGQKWPVQALGEARPRRMMSK